MRDTIYRQDAIDAINTWDKFGIDERSRVVRWHEGLEPYVKLRDVLWAIAKMPPAQTEQRWIPCSERLPDELTPVNITWKNLLPAPYYNDIRNKAFVATGVYYRGDWYWYSTCCVVLLGEYGHNYPDKVDGFIKITAWTPLPAPYRVEEEGEG